jgi:hypothetical protein
MLWARGSGWDDFADFRHKPHRLVRLGLAVIAVDNIDVAVQKLGGAVEKVFQNDHTIRARRLRMALAKALGLLKLSAEVAGGAAHQVGGSGKIGAPILGCLIASLGGRQEIVQPVPLVADRVAEALELAFQKQRAVVVLVSAAKDGVEVGHHDTATTRALLPYFVQDRQKASASAFVQNRFSSTDPQTTKNMSVPPSLPVLGC